MFLITYQKENSYRGHHHEELFTEYSQAKDFLIDDGFLENNRIFKKDKNAFGCGITAHINRVGLHVV